MNLTPFTIVQDSNEGHPWTFEGVKDLRGEDAIVQVEVRPMWNLHEMEIMDSLGGMHTIGLADYSIDGHEKHVQVERKSVADLFSTLGARRDRFEAEITRLHETCDYACVIVEGTMTKVSRWSGHGPSAASVVGTIKQWAIRYGRVHWHMMQSRHDAMQKAFDVFCRYWQDETRGKLARQRL
jgi:hypothetical protein